MKKLTKFIPNVIIALVIIIAFNVCFSGQAITTGSDSLNAIYRGDSTKNKACIMINVYWGSEYIEPILNILNENNIKTTFFVGGYWVSKNEDLLKKIVESGHEVGNHGYNHKDHDKISESQNRDEILYNHKVVSEIVGLEMNLFAPPSGAYNKTTLKVADSLGYKTIMWSKDTIDWRDHDTNLIIQRATKNIQSGDLILAHPTENTVLALQSIIDAYHKQNISLSTVSDTVFGS